MSFFVSGDVSFLYHLGIVFVLMCKMQYLQMEKLNLPAFASTKTSEKR